VLAMSWHKFDSQRHSIDYGSELDLQLQGKFQRITGTLKYASYAAVNTTPVSQRDTDKFWLQIDYSW
jgi:hypothetical protein